MAFRFKQFSIDDSNCAMKVGTDSVLLGSWADFTSDHTILDIGTGCGLLALMAAQKSLAQITAIDINEIACIQASSNFQLSPWHTRLSCIHSDLKEFCNSSEISVIENFSHIITNPPYFTNSLKSPEAFRNTARHNDLLPLLLLLEAVNKLLNSQGKFTLIIPYSDSFMVKSACIDVDLFLSRQLIIIPKAGKDPNRILLEFCKKKEAEIYSSDELTIRDTYGKYTLEYIKMTNQFYLNF